MAREVAEGGEEVDGFDNFGAGLSGLFDLGRDDDEGGAERFFKEGVLAPDGVFAEVPTVVAPENNDGVFGEAKLVELGHNFADLGIGVGNAGSVVFAHLEGEEGVFVGVFTPAIIFHEFT